MYQRGTLRIDDGGLRRTATLRNGRTLQIEVVVVCAQLRRLRSLVLGVHIDVAPYPEIFIFDGLVGLLQIRPLQIADTLDVAQIDARPGDVAYIRQAELAVDQVNQLRQSAPAQEEQRAGNHDDG